MVKFIVKLAAANVVYLIAGVAVVAVCKVAGCDDMTTDLASKAIGGIIGTIYLVK